MPKDNSAEKDNRVFERKDFACLLKFRALPENTEGQGMLRNISGGGLAFVTKEKILPEDRLDLWINIPDGQKPIRKTGKVVWTKENLVDTQETGVRFDSVNLMQLSRLFRFRG